MKWVPGANRCRSICRHSADTTNHEYIDGLVQERRNSIANALELRLSCTNPLIRGLVLQWLSEHIYIDNLAYTSVYINVCNFSDTNKTRHRRCTAPTGRSSEWVSDCVQRPFSNIKIHMNHVIITYTLEPLFFPHIDTCNTQSTDHN